MVNGSLNIDELFLTNYSNAFFTTLFSISISAFIMNSTSFNNIQDLVLISSDSSNVTLCNSYIINSRFNEIQTPIFLFIGNQFSNVIFYNCSFLGNTANNLSTLIFFNGSYQNVSMDSLNFSDNLANYTSFISFTENQNSFMNFLGFLIFLNDNSSTF